MPKNSKYKFDLTFEECKNIIEAIGGLVVVDEDGLVRYLSEDMISNIEDIDNVPLPKDYLGKKIEEIHPTSKISEVLRSGVEDKEAFYFVGGEVNVARIKPITEDGRIIGAIDYDYFSTTSEVKSFLDKVKRLENKGLLYLPESGDAKNSQNGNFTDYKYSITNILGNSSQIADLKQQIYAAAEVISTVLITGETGSGKELVAHSIHNLSSRRQEPFIEVNCAAIPETLFESELFGYESGSFTGADKKGRAGKFELANHGTILLDEIDQIPYHIQPKLLRVLQEREIDRIGSKSIPIDVRVIATTNKDLKELISENKFREDLFYRLNVVNISIPPLRERKDDIPVLVYAQKKALNVKLNRNIDSISDEVLRLFAQYDWPGNVRELFNIMERAMNNCKDKELKEYHLGDFLIDILKKDAPTSLNENMSPLDKIRDNAEKAAIEKALEINNNNKLKTADFLNISRPTLYYKMKAYNIKL